MTDLREDPRVDDRFAELAEPGALVGTTLGGKYRLERLIGRGGMGAVFEAEHVGIGKRFAVKVLDKAWAKDETIAGRFAREARAASSVESDHIVSVVDAGSDAGAHYIVMELLRGEDLGTRLRRDKRVPADVAMHVAAQVLRGLAAAHAVGIVHRDLKPDNVILVEHAGDACFAKIVDFGISKIEKPRSGTAPLALTLKGVVLGTPFYMSPEQAQALTDVDGRADLYSLGAILFECLTGRPPHTGESYEQVLLSICMNDAPDIRRWAPEASDDVAALVARALRRERADRFQSCAEMLEAIHAVIPDDPAARPLPQSVRPAPPNDRTVLSAGGGPPTAVSWASGEAAVPSSLVPAVDPQRARRRTTARVAVTAVVATLAGALVTLFVLTMHGREEAALSLSASAATSAQPPASQTPMATVPASSATSTSTPTSTPTSTTTTTSTATTTSTVAGTAPVRLPSTSGKPAPKQPQGKSLGLQREAPE